MIRPMLNDLNLDELQYYPLDISMSRGGGSCNAAQDPFGRKCVLNKMNEVKLKVFNMIKRINEPKALA